MGALTIGWVVDRIGAAAKGAMIGRMEASVKGAGVACETCSMDLAAAPSGRGNACAEVAVSDSTK